jgi:AAA+ ATPase superfamily predicted ATPase
MFDRDREWQALSKFATHTGSGATLGVVSGRRRQGKSYLLKALCEATGGFYFSAEEMVDGESLRQISAALTAYLDPRGPIVYDDWHDVIDTLLALGNDRPVPVVIDEFPYLARAKPSLPSIIQNAYGPLRPEKDQSRTRLLLCGSAMSFMGRLLGGQAPLRGRAGLELIVPTLDHQLAAQFWGVEDPVTALKVNAIVGGTPAYRREFVDDDTPAGPDDFDSWVARTAFSPASALFREARYLLADEPELRDGALYHSVLAAIANGNANRGGIASYLGRKSNELAHPLNVLEDCGFITREPDMFKDNRTNFRIAEPLVTFYHAVMRPIWSELEHTRDTSQLWRRSQRRFVGNVLGPHFEHVCRFWTHFFAEDELFGDHAFRVGSGTVNDPARQTMHELDVVAFGFDDYSRSPLLAIGECKWGDVMGLGHLERLARIKSLLVAQDKYYAAEDAKLTCFSAAGFTDELRERAANSPDVVLVGAADLYGHTA